MESDFLKYFVKIIGMTQQFNMSPVEHSNAHHQEQNVIKSPHEEVKKNYFF